LQDRLQPSQMAVVLTDFARVFGLQVDDGALLLTPLRETSPSGSDTLVISEARQLTLWLAENREKALLRNESNRSRDDEAQVAHLLWPSRVDCHFCWTDDGTRDQDFLFKYLYIEYSAPSTGLFLEYQGDLNDAFLQQIEETVRSRKQHIMQLQQSSIFGAGLMVALWRGVILRRRIRLHDKRE